MSSVDFEVIPSRSPESAHVLVKLREPKLGTAAMFFLTHEDASQFRDELAEAVAWLERTARP